MNRREFGVLMGGAAALAPFAAHAQQPPPRTIGFLGSATAAEWADLVAAFNRGLNESGYTDGQNVVIEYRWAQDQYDRMPSLALDLVSRRVDVIAATGGTRSVQAAMLATRSIPVIFVTGGNPVQLRLVTNLERPSGNATGVMFSDSAFASKRIEIIKSLVPNARSVATLVNLNNPISAGAMVEMSAAAQSNGLLLHFLSAGTPGELDQAFARATLLGDAGVVVHADPFLLNQRDAIVALAARERLPTIYGLREFVAAGGLMSYGASISAVFRQAGDYTGRILSGAKPSELPVVQSSSYELVINQRAAKAMGLVIPQNLLATANLVIE